MYRISELAGLFGLSRSTLLYYHRLGLLSPSARNRSNYRHYSEDDRQRLERICTYRRAGLSLEDIRTLLKGGQDGIEAILERRLRELNLEVLALQAKQQLLADMLQVKARGWQVVDLDKATWVAMLRAAGMNEAAMDAWHKEFELRAPEAHRAFLLSLGIPEEETRQIRHQAQELL
jgi:MerR family transcriptional regulator, thiopeptide resistance regulator